MTTDNFLAMLHGWSSAAVVGAVSAAALVLVGILVLAAVVLRKLRRAKLARVVTTMATVLGLGWSAQGMWDTAVNHYEQNVVVASVLFVVFEAMQVAKMLKAHEYRHDFARRAKPVRFVWITAVVMAAVVALGEGWTQAPARLAIPLLVAYGWFTDLTADDDPKLRPATSLRWTPRRFALWAGILEPEERDARTIDRDHLRDRMTRMAFRIEHGSATLNDLFRRPVRLARLKTLADDTDLSEVRARLQRSQLDLSTTPAPAPPVRKPKPELVLAERQPELGKQGVHSRAGRTMRGAELKADAVSVMTKSVTPDRPTGMTTSELSALYDPPLKPRTAESFAAEARRPRTNGHRPEGIVIP